MQPSISHPRPEPLEPTILTIFGATGDLSARYLLPALADLAADSLLPKEFRLICVGRRDFTTAEYLKFITDKSQKLSRLSSAVRRKLAGHVTYYRGDFDNPASFTALSKKLSDNERPLHACYNRLYYFATSPEYFTHIADILRRSGLLSACEKHERKVRVLVEKPFGFDRPSARSLNRMLLRYFSEEQIYRIDHYMGKETVQNLMIVRFANVLFEPLWNSRGVDHVEISVLEQEGVGTRGQFFDNTGVVRDIAQNHLLQMLSLIAMDEPRELSVELIRDAKLRVLRALEPAAAEDIVRAQYEGYAEEVGHASQTETYIALKARLNLPRWKGVPFYLRTGKALASRITEISVHFKELPRCLFRNCAANILTFRIQPDESVYLRINNKIPGFGIDLHHGNLEFGYESAFSQKLPGAYERLLLDFIQGDQRLFIRSDEIEAAWKFIDTARARMQKARLASYKPGTDGPKEAHTLIEQDGREWWTE